MEHAVHLHVEDASRVADWCDECLPYGAVHRIAAVSHGTGWQVTVVVDGGEVANRVRRRWT